MEEKKNLLKIILQVICLYKPTSRLTKVHSVSQSHVKTSILSKHFSFSILVHRLDDSDEEHSYFGRKYIGVGTGGTLEIHGERKLSWTFLNKTLHPRESSQNNYLFQRSWGNRGIIIHIIDPKTGEVLHDDR